MTAYNNASVKGRNQYLSLYLISSQYHTKPSLKMAWITGFVVLTHSFRKDVFWFICGVLNYTASMPAYIVLNRGWFNE
jgi:hypothetical protein